MFYDRVHLASSHILTCYHLRTEPDRGPIRSLLITGFQRQSGNTHFMCVFCGNPVVGIVWTELHKQNGQLLSQNARALQFVNFLMIQLVMMTRCSFVLCVPIICNHSSATQCDLWCFDVLTVVYIKSCHVRIRVPRQHHHHINSMWWYTCVGILKQSSPFTYTIHFIFWIPAAGEQKIYVYI